MSSEESNKVVVKIFGEDYPIAGVTNAKYVSRIAKYVDSKMNDIARTSRVKSRDKVAILATLSIASELHEKKEIISKGDKEYESQFDSIITTLDNALGSAS